MSTAKTTTTTKAIVTVPAAVQAAIGASAVAGQKAALAVSQSEQTQVKLSMLIRKSMPEDRTATREALSPYFVAAYAKSGKDDKYASEQLSRVLTLAYPGGAKPDAKTAQKASQELDKAIAANIGTNDLYTVARGSGKVIIDKATKKATVVPIKKDNRGGKNAKTPMESLTLHLGNALTSAKTASLTLEQMAVKTIESLVALQYDLADIRKAFATATKD